MKAKQLHFPFPTHSTASCVGREDAILGLEAWSGEKVSSASQLRWLRLNLELQLYTVYQDIYAIVNLCDFH